MTDTRNPWTPAQKARMAELREINTPWGEVAREVGHSIASCTVTLSKMRRCALRKAADAAMDWEGATPQLPPAVRPAVVDYSRSSISTAKLVMDAELRARIEVMGITGGLLGDPLPGRSALDRRKQAAP